MEVLYLFVIRLFSSAGRRKNDREWSKEGITECTGNGETV